VADLPPKKILQLIAIPDVLGIIMKLSGKRNKYFAPGFTDLTISFTA
jgi:hypothetical protein